MSEPWKSCLDDERKDAGIRRLQLMLSDDSDRVESESEVLEEKKYERGILQTGSMIGAELNCRLSVE